MPAGTCQLRKTPAAFPCITVMESIRFSQEIAAATTPWPQEKTCSAVNSMPHSIARAGENRETLLRLAFSSLCAVPEC